MKFEPTTHHILMRDAFVANMRVALSLLGTTQVLALLVLPLLMLHRCYNFYTARVGPMLAAVEKSRAAVMKAMKQAQSLLGSDEEAETAHLCQCLMA